ncbi:MAG: PAS domain S-box protein [Bryobacteraceae bacterium]
MTGEGQQRLSSLDAPGPLRERIATPEGEMANPGKIRALEADAYAKLLASLPFPAFLYRSAEATVLANAQLLALSAVTADRPEVEVSRLGFDPSLPGRLCVAERLRDGRARTRETMQGHSGSPLEVECTAWAWPSGQGDVLVEVHKVSAGEIPVSAEDFFRATFDHAALGIAHVSTSGRFLALNAKICDILGYSHQELLDRSLYEIIVPEDIAPDLACLKHVVADVTLPPSMEKRVLRKDGSVAWLEIKVSEVRDPSGMPLHFIMVLEEVTGRRLVEERLRQAQKLESLGVLAAGIAHDFNNLLVGVIGGASYVQEILPSNHEAQELLDSVVRAGERAADLTRQLLAYAGKGRFVVRKLDFSALIRDAVTALRPSLPGHVQVELDLTPDLPLVDADPNEVRQIAVNLVTNAAEALSDTAGVVRISIRIEVFHEGDAFEDGHLIWGIQPGAYICLQVDDTGCGIEQANLDKIFDPFFSTKFLGRGLGLSAVSGIVRSHSGSLAVDSVPGKGSSFQVFLPIARQVEEAQAAPAAAAGKSGSLILVVDDEEVVRRTARASLERRGYTTLEAQNGEEAVARFRDRAAEVSLVLLDLTMPGISGAEVLARLREIRPDVRVVITSGFEESDAMQRLDANGVAAFIKKPYTSLSLFEKIRSLL